jgi:hypothetical protein
MVVICICGKSELTETTDLSLNSIQHYVIKFVSNVRQFGGFLRVLRFPPPIKLAPWYNWTIVESGVKQHNPPTHSIFRKWLTIFMRCSYFEVVDTTIRCPSHRTGWPLRNIHFSNDNGSFPCYGNILHLITDKTFNELDYEYIVTWKVLY